MGDWFHKVTNWVSYNRGLFFGLLLGLGLLGLVSCESKNEDPVTGKPMTADQLVVSEEAYARRLKAEQEAAAKDAAARIDALRRATELQITAITAEFELGTRQRQDTAEEFAGRFDLAHESIEKQNALKGTLFTLVREGLSKADPALATGVAGLLGLVTVGLGFDNRRKDRKIKANGQTIPPTTA